jgi:5'-nucleotidase
MTRLTILHTNDLHARVEQVFRIAALARQIKQEVTASGGYCVLCDAGDAEDIILYESSMTKGRAMLALLRGAGYDLETLGNATPLRYGPQAIAGLAEDFGRPLLCANMFEMDSDRLVTGLEPYTLRQFGELTVGAIGLTASMPAYQDFSLKLGDPLQMLPRLIAEVRACGAQTIVLLSHLGSKQDQALAEQIDGVDVIIGAHDHIELNPPLVIKRTIIVQAGDYGRFLGRLDLDLDPRSGQIVRHQGELLPIGEALPIDPAAQQAFEAQQARVRRSEARVLGVASGPIDLAYDRECAAGNLLADALRERMHADIALALSGQWQSEIAAGPITAGKLYAAIRSTANPGRVALSGGQILHFLHAALDPENMARTPTWNRGTPIGMPHVAGLTVYRSLSAPQTLKVFVGDKPLQPDRHYLVAGTDMEFEDYVGYLSLATTPIDYEMPTIMPEVLEDYIARHTPIGSLDQRFFFLEE